MDFLWLFVKYFFLVEDNTWTKCGKHVASDNILFALGSGRTMAPSTSLVKKKGWTNEWCGIFTSYRTKFHIANIHQFQLCEINEDITDSTRGHKLILLDYSVVKFDEH